jgi:hypothetical protein
MQELPALRLTNEQAMIRLSTALESLARQIDELEERILALCEEHLSHMTFENIPDLTVATTPSWSTEEGQRLAEAEEATDKLEELKNRAEAFQAIMFELAAASQEN